jgi:hypothetical protein
VGFKPDAAPVDTDNPFMYQYRYADPIDYAAVFMDPSLGKKPCYRRTALGQPPFELRLRAVSDIDLDVGVAQVAHSPDLPTGLVHFIVA